MNKVLLVGVLAIAVILISVVGFLNYNPSYKTSQTGLKVNLESAPSTGVLLSPVQAQASTGVQGYTVGAWIELSNLSGIAPSGTVTSQFINNISKDFGTTFSEVLVHNSTSSAIVFVSKAVSQNISTGFRKIALILVAGYNFNVNKSGNMEYVYGNISGTGISLGYDGTYLVGAVVNGVQEPAQSALSLLMNQYQDVVNSQSALVQPPSIFSSVPNMKLALWAYVNYTALKSLNLSQGFKMGGIMGLNKLNSMSAYSKFQNTSRNMKLNVSTGYLASMRIVVLS
ncbi:hypothetical protein [Metallosphaera hakonensis]|uniref:hypothetical protein n=1 Tax=Metallosphaera hakonensis TaxID=79601 RepID=UPI0006D1C48A|nr:hypothetical protein [Metallosphaera hakonensis]